MLTKPTDNRIPLEVMRDRLHSDLQRQLPLIDYSDLLENRQFAPEYSQQVYQLAISEENVLGDYFEGKKSSHLAATRAHRKEMVRLIENLAARKEYKLETIYLAVNIADRYLFKLSRRG